MKILVVGASRGTGREIVNQALEKGHSVTAFARNIEELSRIKSSNLSVKKGDVLDQASVDDAIVGQEAVLSALGRTDRGPTTLFSEGTRNIIKSMNEAGIRRLVVLSAAGIFGNDVGFLTRVGMSILLKNSIEDRRREVQVLENSRNIDWVLVRPAMLTNGDFTGRCRVTMDKPAGSKISRADVADFMLKQLMTGSQYIGKMPIISS